MVMKRLDWLRSLLVEDDYMEYSIAAVILRFNIGRFNTLSDEDVAILGELAPTEALRYHAPRLSVEQFDKLVPESEGLGEQWLAQLREECSV